MTVSNGKKASRLCHDRSLIRTFAFAPPTEPGYYADGKWGIRIESVVIVREVKTPNNFGEKGFLGFENITMVGHVCVWDAGADVFAKVPYSDKLGRLVNVDGRGKGVVEYVSCRSGVQGGAVARRQGRTCVGVAQETVSGCLKALSTVRRTLPIREGESNALKVKSI